MNQPFKHKCYVAIFKNQSEKIADIFEFVAGIKDVDYLVEKYLNVDVRRGDRVIITIIKKDKK